MLTKAIIPAAGMGSRMLPMTRVVPKELFPLGDKPVIHHIVDEAIAAGLTELCIVIRAGKEIIRDYFSRADGLLQRCDLQFVEQQRPLGLGDAMRCARQFVAGDRFVLLIPDQLIAGEKSAAQQLVAFDDGVSIVSSVVRIERRELPHFSGARGFALRPDGSREFIVDRLLTEAETAVVSGGAEYELRGFGRTIYPPAILDYLGPEFTNPDSGEVDLLRTFEAISGRLPHRAALLDGRPADIGTLPGYYRYLCSFAEVAA